MPTPRNRHGKIWIASGDGPGDGPGEIQGAPPKSRSADFAHGRSHRDACQPTQGNKCHYPRDVLNHPHRVARAGHARIVRSPAESDGPPRISNVCRSIARSFSTRAISMIIKDIMKIDVADRRSSPD